MGEKNVDRIIEAWRAEARAAGEPAPSAPQEPRRGRAVGVLRRFGRVRVLAAAAAVAVFTVVAVAVLAGAPEVRPTAEPAVESGSPSLSPSPAQSPAPSLSPSTSPSSAASQPRQRQPLVEGWFSVVQQIDAVRTKAYAQADPAVLAEAFEAGSPALASEQAAVQALADAGLHADGWGTELLAVSQTERTGERVELRVTDKRGSYDLVAADGTRTTVPAAERSDWLVELVAKSGTWVVARVEPLPGEGVTSPSSPPG